MGLIINPYRYGGGGGGGPDANTIFLTRFSAATPVDEVSAASGTLAGNANCDTTNKRLNVDGSGDSCSFNGGSINTNVTTGWTVETHVEVANGTADAVIVAKDVVAAGGWILWYSLGSNTLQFYAYDFNAYAAAMMSAGSVFGLGAGEKHCAVVRDGSTWRMYAAGVQVASQAWAGAPANSSAHLTIGNDTAGAGRDLQGTIGRVKISDVCRYPSGTTFTPPARTDP